MVAVPDSGGPAGNTRAARWAPQPKSAESTPAERTRQAWLYGLAAGIPVSGLLAIGVYSSTLGGHTARTAVGAGLGVATAAGTLGMLLGFLFGIPRSMQDDQHPPGAADNARNYRPNTNLEQISDWLTKILVGIGLVEFGNAIAPIRRLVRVVGETLGNTAAARVIAGVILIVYLVWGFLLSYLLTRSKVATLFEESELERIKREAAEFATEKATDEVRRKLSAQAAHDIEALGLVEQVLNPSAETVRPSQEEVEAALRNAVPQVRMQAFYRAHQHRHATWRTDKQRMANTIRLFRALIAADREGRYHRNHGQLGFALKDQARPDWEGALDALTEAINRRGDSEDFLLYEFNRALCRIALDPPDGRSSDEARGAILDDLRRAAENSQLRTRLRKDPAVLHWLATNGLSLADLDG
jgi:hypothetical protein